MMKKNKVFQKLDIEYKWHSYIQGKIYDIKKKLYKYKTNKHSSTNILKPPFSII
jgi:hypothetical protein